jgi:hypothetical protein
VVWSMLHDESNVKFRLLPWQGQGGKSTILRGRRKKANKTSDGATKLLMLCGDVSLFYKGIVRGGVNYVWY